MKHIFTFLIFCTLSFYSLSAHGQDAIVRAELSSDTVMVGHQFTLTYTVEGGQINGLVDPDLAAFDLLSGPNTSTSMSIINGKMSSQSTVNFILQAKKVGDYTIDPVNLTVNGEEVEIKSLNINIVENPDGLLLEDLMPNTPKVSKSKKKVKTYKI